VSIASVAIATLAAVLGCTARSRPVQPPKVAPIPAATLAAFVKGLSVDGTALFTLDLPGNAGRLPFRFVVVSSPAPQDLSAGLVFARGVSTPAGPTARLLVVNASTIEVAIFDAGSVHISRVEAERSFEYQSLPPSYRNGRPCFVRQEDDVATAPDLFIRDASRASVTKKLRMAVAVGPGMRERYGDDDERMNLDTIKTLFYANEVLSRDLGVELLLWGPVLKATQTGADTKQTLVQLHEHILKLVADTGRRDPVDLGHLLEDGSGGSALVESLCRANSKAGAYTGSQSFIVYGLNNFIHEVGHQLGAPHSFNAQIDDRHARGAFEPGMGISIMSYASASPHAPPDQQRQLYFHASSMRFIEHVLQHGPAGERSCGITAEEIPRRPHVKVEEDEWHVPPFTPFELEVVPDASVESYRWDAYHRGSIPNGVPPFFASSAAREPARVYPFLRDLLSARSPKITWPSGTTKFRVLGFSPAGSRDYEDVDIHVERGLPFKVLRVDCTGGCTPGSTLKVSWLHGNTFKDPFNVETLRAEILENVDGVPVKRYAISTASALDNRTRHADIQLPPGLPPMQEARLILRANGGIFLSFSKPFTIVAPPHALAQRSLPSRDRQQPTAARR
jgi:Metallo-peptidase family M12B Reprolysin-like